MPGPSSPAPAPQMEIDVKRATVIGGGAFGTALGMILAKKGAHVRVWVRDEAQVATVNATKQNAKYLPGLDLPSNLEWMSDVRAAVADTDIIMLVIPTQFLRPFLEANRSTFPVGVPLVLCAKGIEVNSFQTPYEIMKDELPGKYGKYIAVLAGPSFAKEMVKYQPTNVSVAAEDAAVAETVQRMMSCRAANFRAYTTTDIMGCEVAGAVKNVLAIASGCSSGLGFGNNARAGMICRGLAEMTQIATKLGSNGQSMAGLAGIGDLLLTCSSELSRNFTVGFRLAKGETLDDIIASTSAVAEGVATAKALWGLCEKVGVTMPICGEVYRVLYEGKSVPAALMTLQDRPLTKE